jgi:NAD(P)-dependent dehydrogenase (short-subunit alcohol dehydrogenase family)
MSHITVERLTDIPIPTDIGGIFRLDGTVSLVTGAGSGLGEAIALGLAHFGSEVILCDMNAAGLSRVKQRIENLGTRCDTYTMDVTSWERIQECRHAIRGQQGKVDVLVNCAGMNIRKPVLELQPEEFRKVTDVNLFGTFLCCKAFGEMMVERRSGSIINMASINAHIAMEKQAGYASSKGGIVQLTKVLALEWARHNVRVNALSPAHHKTPLVVELVKDPAWYEDLVGRIPLGRFAEAHEIVGPAVFLASKASSFMTGISLLTDGGWTAI